MPTAASDPSATLPTRPSPCRAPASRRRSFSAAPTRASRRRWRCSASKTAACSTRLLSCGYVDAIAAHETGILQYMKDNSVEFRILEEPLLVTGLGAAFAKNDTRGLDSQLTDTLAQMRADGTLEQILGRYLEHASQYLEVDTIGT
ncbi:MAG: transporter substrate-binding domain-containing protein [Faecalibacterium prausnitzii]